MLIFSLQCQTFDYSVVSATDAAVPLDPDLAPNSPVSHDNCLFLLVGVEAADTLGKAGRAAKAVGKIVNNTGVKKVVINGFASLARTPAAPEHSRELLSRLQTRLTEREPGLFVESMPFGWRKDWMMEVLSGQWAQRCIHV